MKLWWKLTRMIHHILVPAYQACRVFWDCQKDLGSNPAFTKIWRFRDLWGERYTLICSPLSTDTYYSPQKRNVYYDCYCHSNYSNSMNEGESMRKTDFLFQCCLLIFLPFYHFSSYIISCRQMKPISSNKAENCKRLDKKGSYHTSMPFSLKKKILPQCHPCDIQLL